MTRKAKMLCESLCIVVEYSEEFFWQTNVVEGGGMLEEV